MDSAKLVVKKVLHIHTRHSNPFGSVHIYSPDAKNRFFRISVRSNKADQYRLKSNRNDGVIVKNSCSHPPIINGINCREIEKTFLERNECRS